MTRKDFQFFADMIRREAETYEHDKATLASIAETMATYFEVVNPRFDNEKFMTACGMPNGEWAI